MLERGVIVRAIGESTVACCPPLVMTDEEVDRVVDAYASVLTHTR
jgi:adenosylmethionine-8-amino-7-oxononanoate aminotransferase